MSWAEVMSALNKRQDKTLDEIMLEMEERSEGVLNYVSTNVTASGSIVKLTGEGRIYHFLVALYKSSNDKNYDNIQILVDDEVWYDIDVMNTYGSYYMGVITTNQPTWINGNDATTMSGYPGTLYNYGFGAKICGFIDKGKFTLEDSSANRALAIYIPKYIKFNKSFEIRVTCSSTKTFLNDNVTVGYKMN